MSNNLVISDDRSDKLRDELRRRWDSDTKPLVPSDKEEALVAPTFFVVGKGGGTGRSTLALTLEFLMRQEALIIEVGGNRCPAFRNRPLERHTHFPSRDPDRIDRALDARFEAASRVAILEFEPALYRETIEIAANFRKAVSHSNLMVFYVAGHHEENPAYRARAKERELRRVIFCRQAVQLARRRDANFVFLPWLHQDITHSMHAGCATLSQALDQCSGIWTQTEARGRLAGFMQAILAGEGQ